MLPVTPTDFCYGRILWLYLNRLPSFFLHEYHPNLKNSALFASGVFLSGVVVIAAKRTGGHRPRGSSSRGS
jgi:hypothetical protein